LTAGFREKSTKTRIETIRRPCKEGSRCHVLEKNPPKQGLKHGFGEELEFGLCRFREKSTKTRIETEAGSLSDK